MNVHASAWARNLALESPEDYEEAISLCTVPKLPVRIVFAISSYYVVAEDTGLMLDEFATYEEALKACKYFGWSVQSNVYGSSR